ncbi:MAG: terminase small subunit [Ewingella sp.]|uniref:terminase small subunit n=1 Tax=Ewingella sp. TaxID=1897459 RepID=UPI003F913AC4
MAKPDWGTLQNQYLADHASTGISPKEWCEAQGLNYTSARRYIKKPSAQKTAHKELRKTAQKQTPLDDDRAASASSAQEEPPENEGVLKPQHEQFAQNIARGMTQKEAAICAGYSPTRADTQAPILLKRPDVRRRIRELRQEAALLVTFDAKDLAELSYKSAQQALVDKKFGQVAPNVKNAAQLTGIDMAASKTEVNVDLAGLSYGKVCIVTPANCPSDVWASHMEKLRAGKTIAQS